MVVVVVVVPIAGRRFEIAPRCGAKPLKAPSISGVGSIRVDVAAVDECER